MTTLNPPSQTSVPARRIEEPDRMNILPRHFGRIMLLVENAVYFWAGKLSQDYRGGFWDFYEFDDGGFYMAPQADRFRVAVDTNGYEGEMSADAFGITCCLFAFSHLSFQIDDDALSRHYGHLYEFALEHAESREIFGATD